MRQRVDIVLLRTNRSYYSREDCANETMTVGDLISALRQYNLDDPIMFSNDGGYTYGYISEESLKQSSYVEGEDD